MESTQRLIDIKPLMTNGWHLVQTGESNRFIRSMSLADVPVVTARECSYGVWLDAGKNVHGQNLTRCSVCNANSIEGGRFCRCCGAVMRQ